MMTRLESSVYPSDKVSVEPTLCNHGALLAEPTYHRRRERNLNEIGLNVA